MDPERDSRLTDIRTLTGLQAMEALLFQLGTLDPKVFLPLLSLLNAVDVWGNQGRGLHTWLNFDTLSYFTDTALRTPLRGRNWEAPDPDDFMRLYHLAGQFSGDLDVPEDSNALFTLIAPLVNRQFPLQEEKDPLFAAVRNHVMLSVLPSQHPNTEVRLRGHQENYAFAQVFQQHTGLTYPAFHRVVFAVYAWLMELGKRHSWSKGHQQQLWGALPEGDDDAFKRLWPMYYTHYCQQVRYQAMGVFYPETFRIVASPDEVERYLKVMSAPLETLIELGKTPEFNEGGLVLRSSVLERYPIVQVPWQGRTGYVVPSARYFIQAIQHLPDLILQMETDDLNKRTFPVLLGWGLELYFEHLARHALPPHALVLPEFDYRFPGGRWRSPDLTVVDPVENTVVLIELKAKRSTLRMRVEGGHTDTYRKLKDILDDFKKVDTKLQHLKEGHEGWGPVREKLQVETLKAVAVLVIPDHQHLLMEKVQEAEKHQSRHPLSDLQMPYLVLSQEEMERFFEASRKYNISLYQLLMEETTTDPAVGAQQHLNRLKAKYPAGRTFLRQYFDDVWPLKGK